MKKHKHIPQYITPSREEVLPLGREKSLRFIAMLITHHYIVDYVACTECGMIGHRIKSRRGGFRWHTDATPDEKRRTCSEASMFYEELGLEKPEGLCKLATQI